MGEGEGEGEREEANARIKVEWLVYECKVHGRTQLAGAVISIGR